MAVDPSAKISSIVNLGLSESAPDGFTQPESKTLYSLFVQGLTNILSNLELYCGLSQKPMTQWSLLTPSATLRKYQLARLYLQASETIIYGGFVNFHNVGGVLKARNANSATGRRAHGFCNINNTAQSGMALGQYGEIIVGQGIIAIGGVSPGDELFLAPVNGQIQVGPDVVAGHIEQYIGFGVGTNLVAVEITHGSWIQH